jgi:mRNA-degrading endonuclease toxin of MazEF toxin-antitoxin module
MKKNENNTNNILKGIVKDFSRWFRLKQKLHENSARGPLVHERELWWVSFGENVGSEINGKSDLYSRPAVVLKKLAHGFFLVAPTTSQAHMGSWYVPVVFNGRETFVCLHQIRTIDYRRLSSRIGRLSGTDFTSVKAGFLKLYGGNDP